MSRVHRHRTRLRETDADTLERKDLDIIDIINSSTDARRVEEEEEEEGQFVEVTDGGVDEFEEDCDSVTSSIASGPSLRHSSVSPQAVKPSQGLCSACKTLYQKTNKKAPLKKQLLDNNPESLTCDQWVLVRSWRPRRLPNASGKLLTCVQQLKERLAVQKGSKGPAQYVVESSACSKPHTFLRRNLRRRIRTLVKGGGKRRKRTRDGSQSCRAAKQQRLHSNNQGKRVSISPTCGDGGTPDFDDCSNQEVNNQADANLTPELIPSTVTVETNTREVPPEQKASKTWGFRVLLAQLRGNSSMIVRE
ncbi:uncharacterized protein AB9W97_021677 isoform 2-T3 [Spinachia spinachia]